MDKIFVAKGLQKKYGKSVVLDQIDMSIKQGEIYGLVGENGAGKSSIMKIITGLSDPTAGEIYLFGKKGRKELEQERKKLGCLIESPTLYKDMTARQNLEIQRVQRGLPRKQYVDEILELVELQDTGKKIVKNFSLGMKQRLGLAIALMGIPKFLILDEPINGLDPTKIRYIREVLQNLNSEEGTTILISSHILSELHQLATVYGFIHKGRMLQQVTDKELDERCKKHVHIQLDNIEKASCILDDMFNECTVKVYPEGVIRIYGYTEDVAVITKKLVDADVMVRSIGYRGEDLETYYTNLLEGAFKNETA